MMEKIKVWLKQWHKEIHSVNENKSTILKGHNTIEIYTILKAPVSTVVTRHLFINNPSQLFQFNPLHAYIWPNGGLAWAIRSWATTLAHARHVGLLTVMCQSVGAFD
jgi:hypothetical protein